MHSQVCKYPVELAAQTYTHMSFFSTASHKILCAVATSALPSRLPALLASPQHHHHAPGRALGRGPASSASRGASRAAWDAETIDRLLSPPAIAYALPASATVEQQQTAFGAALALARLSDRAVHLPPHVFVPRRGRSALCSMMDVQTIPDAAPLLAPRACATAPPTPTRTHTRTCTDPRASPSAHTGHR